MNLGDVFGDAEVARLYAFRPPYPAEVLTILRGLLVEPGAVLDAGAGTGALARPMASFADRIDAVDPSAAMIAAAGDLRDGRSDRIRWIVGRVEDARLAPPYGLITCGASLHWMDLDLVLPRFRDALAPGAVVAIADTENVHGPYQDDVLAVIGEYSEIKHHSETKDLMEELRVAGRFRVDGQKRTLAMPFQQSVTDYIEFLHSTSSLARVRLGSRSAEFDGAIRAVFARHRIERLRYGIVGLVTWGRPS